MQGYSIRVSSLIPVHDRPGNRVGYWYRPIKASFVHRYTFLPSACISLAPVLVFANFITANKKASSKTIVHKNKDREQELVTDSKDIRARNSDH